MINRLEPIIAHKRQEVAALYQQLQQEPHGSLAMVIEGRLTLPPCQSFKHALQAEKLAIIAEIKRKSPSKGHLATIADPLTLATHYVQGGASAISILTDTPFFGGHISDLQQVATHFATQPSPLHKETRDRFVGAKNISPSLPETTEITHRVPLLRKDFIIDPIQLAEARLAGADAVLAIVAVLGSQTATIIARAKTLGLDVLVEVHDADELDVAINAGADIIGVNNRDLTTMKIDTEQALRLLEHIPSHICKVAESGILVPELAKRYRQAGFDAVLIGEALVTTDDPQRFIGACRDV